MLRRINEHLDDLDVFNEAFHKDVAEMKSYKARHAELQEELRLTDGQTVDGRRAKTSMRRKLGQYRRRFDERKRSALLNHDDINALQLGITEMTRDLSPGSKPKKMKSLRSEMERTEIERTYIPILCSDSENEDEPKSDSPPPAYEPPVSQAVPLDMPTLEAGVGLGQVQLEMMRSFAERFGPPILPHIPRDAPCCAKDSLCERTEQLLCEQKTQSPTDEREIPQPDPQSPFFGGWYIQNYEQMRKIDFHLKPDHKGMLFGRFPLVVDEWGHYPSGPINCFCPYFNRPFRLSPSEKSKHRCAGEYLKRPSFLLLMRPSCPWCNRTIAFRGDEATQLPEERENTCPCIDQIHSTPFTPYCEEEESSGLKRLAAPNMN